MFPDNPVIFETPYTIQMIRDALKEAFPATKFSVRRGTGSAREHADITWTNGPSEVQVLKFVNRLMDDIIYGEGNKRNGLTSPLHSVAYRMIDGRPEPIRFNVTLIRAMRLNSQKRIERASPTETIEQQPSPIADAFQRCSSKEYADMVARIQEQDKLRAAADEVPTEGEPLPSRGRVRF